MAKAWQAATLTFTSPAWGGSISISSTTNGLSKAWHTAAFIISHLEDDLPPSLEHAKNRGFLLLKGSATATAFQSAAASLASLGFEVWLSRLMFYSIYSAKSSSSLSKSSKLAPDLQPIMATMTLIALAVFLVRMKPPFGYLFALAMRTAHPVRPAHLSDLFVAFGIIYQVLKAQHGLAPSRLWVSCQPNSFALFRQFSTSLLYIMSLHHFTPCASLRDFKCGYPGDVLFHILGKIFQQFIKIF